MYNNKNNQGRRKEIISWLKNARQRVRPRRGDFYATCEQIGELLGYSDPANAIRIIHKSNKARLEKFSMWGQIDRGMKSSRTAIVYNFKGLLEICRYSNQPKTDAVMDWLWEIADELRRTGTPRADESNLKTSSRE